MRDLGELEMACNVSVKTALADHQVQDMVARHRWWPLGRRASQAQDCWSQQGNTQFCAKPPHCWAVGLVSLLCRECWQLFVETVAALLLDCGIEPLHSQIYRWYTSWVHSFHRSSICMASTLLFNLVHHRSSYLQTLYVWHVIWIWRWSHEHQMSEYNNSRSLVGVLKNYTVMDHVHACT